MYICRMHIILQLHPIEHPSPRRLLEHERNEVRNEPLKHIRFEPTRAARVLLAHLPSSSHRALAPAVAPASHRHRPAGFFLCCACWRHSCRILMQERWVRSGVKLKRTTVAAECRTHRELVFYRW